MKRYIVCLFILLINCGYCFAASENMKGVWVATAYGLDYPLTPTVNSEQLKQETDAILNNAYDMGMNAVFLQVRPSADALYNSNIFPWSKWLTGKNGVSPNNGFDTLEYWVEEAHKRGLELHAWINPYRITNGENDYSGLSDKSPAKMFPEYIVKYSDGNYYFDPGIPEVRRMIIEGALEIVNNYDIDGIHMDDYFYPGTNFDDSESYLKYGKEYKSLDDFRRASVDILIKEMGEKIKLSDKDVSFGISPAGIWANKSKKSLGSDTNGLQSYYSHYADTRKWALNGWIDYIAPQIYWNIGVDGSDYSILVNWWAETLKKSTTKLYIGIADYRTETSDSKSVWYNGKEIKKQLELNDKLEKISGEIHYRYSSITKSDALKKIIEKEYNKNNIKMFCNGDRVRFDQEPIIKNNRTLVPMRAIFEALGAEVKWDGDSRTVIATKGKLKISLPIGSKEMKVGSAIKTLDVVAEIVNGRTMVPARAISEAFSADVVWNGISKTVDIKTK